MEFSDPMAASILGLPYWLVGAILTVALFGAFQVYYWVGHKVGDAVYESRLGRKIGQERIIKVENVVRKWGHSPSTGVSSSRAAAHAAVGGGRAADQLLAGISVRERAGLPDLGAAGLVRALFGHLGVARARRRLCRSWRSCSPSWCWSCWSVYVLWRRRSRDAPAAQAS